MMNLSTNNKVTITLQTPEVNKYYYYTISFKNKPIYLGRYYLLPGKTDITIYYNDIVNNYKYNNNLFDRATEVNAVYNIATTFTISVYDDIQRTDLIQTVNVYPFLNTSYPFKDFKAPFATPVESSSTKREICMPYLQGIEYASLTDETTELMLYPHYPAILTDKLSFGQVFNTGIDIHELILGIKDEEYNFDYESFLLVDQATDFYLTKKMSDFGGNLGYTDGIYLSNDIWSTITTSGYKLFKVKIDNIYDDQDQELYWFILDWGYSDDYFKPYDETYIRKYSIYKPSTGRYYREYLAKVPVERLTEYMRLVTELRQYYTITLHEVNNKVDFCSTSALFRGVATVTDMNELLYNVYGMDANFFRNKNSDFYWVVDGEETASVEFNTPYAVYDTALLTDIWNNNEAALTSDAFMVDSQLFKLSDKSATPTYKEDIDYKLMKLADIDICPAKYYLQWFDRFGGIQCQPFDGKSTPSISYNTAYITNFIEEKRIYDIGYTSKWELNTNWIDEKYYPLYESIFVSPYLKLYDTINDKAYNVIITDQSYTEKTFDNQRDLFNLTINLIENSEKHIIN